MAARTNAYRLEQRATAGYTLIELMFVVFLVALVLSIAMPQLMPALAFSQLEGSARHLANYGRSAVAYSALHRQPITVRFDLGAGEYWCLEWDPLVLEGEGNVTGDFFEDDDDPSAKSLGNENEMTLEELMATGAPEDLEAQSLDVLYELDMAFRRSLEAQAKNVPRETIMGERFELSDEEFRLNEEQEAEREEVTDPLLNRSRFPEDVRIESVLLSGQLITEGVIDIEVTPLGLSQSVSFILLGPKEQYYTVVWDPITGGAHLVKGKDISSALEQQPL